MANHASVLSSDPSDEVSMVGTLDTWPLQDLLLWLNRSGRTAMVRVGAGLDAGVIFVSSGYLFRCEWGNLQGAQALYGLLQLREGVFCLTQREVPQPCPNISVPTEQLLLQCAVALDESRPRAIA